MGQWKFHHLPSLASLWVFLLHSISHNYFMKFSFSGGGFEGEKSRKMSSQVKTSSIIDRRGQDAGSFACKSNCDW